ncbi:hypothetical protein [Companilactobacillus sp. DQM5]|uniref:hypothetical protein n=1 Tax=Companilactobacillus sp. DQM5 TaxID=3463359 RepID=UPI0040595FBC
MAKKSHFLLGVVVGSAVSYAVTKYVLPMSSKEDLVEKFNDIKEGMSESIESFDKEKIIDDFNSKTSDLKNNIDKQINKKLASDDNFENIILDENNLNLKD